MPYITKAEQAAQNKPYEPKGASHWRNRLTDWEKQAFEVCEDIVYGMTMDGASQRDIADYFNLKFDEFRVTFKHVLTMARADLAITIKKNQIKLLKSNKMPQAQALIGRLFAGQSENEASTEVEPTADGVSINVRVVRSDDFVPPQDGDSARLAAVH